MPPQWWRVLVRAAPPLSLATRDLVGGKGRKKSRQWLISSHPGATTAHGLAKSTSAFFSSSTEDVAESRTAVAVSRLARRSRFSRPGDSSLLLGCVLRTYQSFGYALELLVQVSQFEQAHSFTCHDF